MPLSESDYLGINILIILKLNQNTQPGEQIYRETEKHKFDSSYSFHIFSKAANKQANRFNSFTW